MRHLKHHTVVAYLALFVALGGTGYAAAKITGRDVKDRSLTLKDLSKKTVKALSGKRGPAGLPGKDGLAGAKGDKGDPGSPDVSNFFTKAESDERFLGAGAKAASADKLDDLDSSDLRRMPSGATLVRATGDTTQAGIALRAAVDAATAGDVILIEPGTYNVGTAEALEIPAFVKLLGSGAGVTRIERTIPASGAVVSFGGSNVELRDLSVTASGAGTTTLGISASGFGGRLEDVEVTATGPQFTGAVQGAQNMTITDSTLSAASGGLGSTRTISSDGGATRVLRSTVNASSGGESIAFFASNGDVSTLIDSVIDAKTTVNVARGVHAQEALPTIVNSEVTALETGAGDDAIAVLGVDPGVNATTTLVKVRGSYLRGEESAVATQGGGGPTVKIVSSVVDGVAAGAVSCLITVKGDFSAHDADCIP